MGDNSKICADLHVTLVNCSFIFFFFYLLNFNYTDLNIIYTLEDKLTIKISKKKKCKNHKIRIIRSVYTEYKDSL